MPKDNSLGRHSPEEQLAGFSRTGLGKYLVLAIVVHAIVIVATSVGFIRAQLDPEWYAEQQRIEQEAAEVAVKNQQAMQEGKAIQDERKAETADSAAPQPAATDVPAESAQSKAAALNAKIEQAFAEAGIDPNDPLVKERLSDVPKERWLSQEIIDSVRPARKQEIPQEPNLLDISIDDTN
jgi:hypothetical protein